MVSTGQSNIKTAPKSPHGKPRPRKDGQSLLHVMRKALSPRQLAEEGAGEREPQPAAPQVLEVCKRWITVIKKEPNNYAFFFFLIPLVLY